MAMQTIFNALTTRKNRPSAETPRLFSVRGQKSGDQAPCILGVRFMEVPVCSDRSGKWLCNKLQRTSFALTLLASMASHQVMAGQLCVTGYCTDPFPNYGPVPDPVFSELPVAERVLTWNGSLSGLAFAVPVGASASVTSLAASLGIDAGAVVPVSLRLHVAEFTTMARLPAWGTTAESTATRSRYALRSLDFDFAGMAVSETAPTGAVEPDYPLLSLGAALTNPLTGEYWHWISVSGAGPSLFRSSIPGGPADRLLLSSSRFALESPEPAPGVVEAAPAPGATEIPEHVAPKSLYAHLDQRLGNVSFIAYDAEEWRVAQALPVFSLALEDADSMTASSSHYGAFPDIDGALESLLPKGEFTLRLFVPGADPDPTYGLPGQSLSLTGTLSAAPGVPLTLDPVLGVQSGLNGVTGWVIRTPAVVELASPVVEVEVEWGEIEWGSGTPVPLPGGLWLLAAPLVASIATTRRRRGFLEAADTTVR